MTAADFPENMPAVWDALWGRLPARIGVPVILGEWGGHWDEAWGRPGTHVWQSAMAAYLNLRNISYFYWALNDNARKTGGLFPSDNHQKLAMLQPTPKTSVLELQEAWRTPPPPSHPPRPPESPPPVPPPSPPPQPPPRHPPPAPPPPTPPPASPPRTPPPPLLPPPFAPPPTLSAVLGDNVASIAGGLLLATVWLAVKCARRRNTRNTRALKGAKLAMEELGAEAMPPDSSSTKWVVGDTEMGAQPAPVTVPGMDTDPARERDSAAAPAGQEAQNKEAHNGEEPGKMKPRGAKAKKKLPKGARKGKADAESLQGLVPAAEVVDQTPRLERKLPPLNLDLD